MRGKRQTIGYCFRASLPVFAGYLVLGMGFGILLENAGYHWLVAPFMSILIYGGSMQYVAVDLLSGGASILATAMMTVLINVRHIFYGITMVEKYRDTKKKKPYLIFSLTDETFSLVCNPTLPDWINEHDYYFFLSLFNQSYWILGGTIGALVGNQFALDTRGVEFSMTALFVIIFVEQWEKATSHIPALTGLLVSVICLVLFQTNFLVPAMISITIALFLERGILQGGTVHD